MKIYCIQYIYDNGDEFWRYFDEKQKRDRIYEIETTIEKEDDLTLIKRDFEEIKK